MIICKLFGLQSVKQSVRCLHHISATHPGPSTTNGSITKYVSPTDLAELFGKDDALIKRFSVTEMKASSEFKTEYWEDTIIVHVTGLVNRSGKNFRGKIGIYWGNNDEHNIYKGVESSKNERISLPLAEVEAINTALRQAVYEKKLTRIIIKTDSEFVVKCVERYLPNWRRNGFKKRDGSPVKNGAQMEELNRLLQLIDAKVLFEHMKTPSDNDVINMLKSDERVLQDILDDQANSVKGNLVEPTDSPPQQANTVYVCARSVNTAYAMPISSYGIHWPERSNWDACGRFVVFPITEFRARLFGIIQALECAIKNELGEICLVTDCERFIRFRRQNWIKKDGTKMANFMLYEMILQLEERVKVRYYYVPQVDNDHIDRAQLLADDGLAYPIFKKNQKLSNTEC